ncbi:zinc ABC transporter ATP-binding protein AztA [Nocardia inohanensis]|uniref:zinc ABC transporter ATP-binding protein AztA n=1 Tax=Nocardia inohanensis TaxID=209246 RepID=UPI000AE3D6DA|nr:zinc ABC transporter ATP-binding protein AztA [Nocardia inohanensis]
MHTSGLSTIQLTEVSAGYAGKTVLHEITATIPAARVTAIVGPNGSGKSTLLGVLAGIVRPDTGRVEHPGSYRSATDRPALVVQQSAIPATLPITVRETVTMGRWGSRGPWRRLTRADRALVDSCMERMGVTALADRRVTTLSGGQRQRTLLAQALAQQSGLLLLDEPATGLDAEAQQDISRTLHELAAAGVTVVQTTHDQLEADRADHCLHLRDGRLQPPRPDSGE